MWLLRRLPGNKTKELRDVRRVCYSQSHHTTLEVISNMMTVLLYGSLPLVYYLCCFNVHLLAVNS